ncbi:hypothetical protein IMG5_125090 [Ichthyophthirius multifiliis]|uniref:Transmembrane protein n=1 Tax=Ichthyophthirius multifiliis TaxID=5932 RepID=G0QVP6_ICHMU|nr:hypothetical protein IMG5_125090 [Ichthyophthirius multifiliis]EGR30707.1 hypothetical protein IMG5_125090 [Ichthyophthirius multifiliis]|eukprot:XP_004032294.1 hypothetical protein IMG5_125090 [Ichthyophthirius multifiliis]
MQAFIQFKYFQVILIKKNNGFEQGNKKVSKDEIESRKIQLALLILSNLIPAFVQFFWDYFAFSNAISEFDCYYYFYSRDFLTFVIFLIGKIVIFFVQPCLVYYIFFWQNKKYFKSVQDNLIDKNDAFFYDRRSELLENQDDYYY